MKAESDGRLDTAAIRERLERAHVIIGPDGGMLPNGAAVRIGRDVLALCDEVERLRATSARDEEREQLEALAALADLEEEISDVRMGDPQGAGYMDSLVSVIRAALLREPSQPAPQGERIEVFLPYGASEVISGCKAEARSCRMHLDTYPQSEHDESAWLVIQGAQIAEATALGKEPCFCCPSCGHAVRSHGKDGCAVEGGCNYGCDYLRWHEGGEATGWRTAQRNSVPSIREGGRIGQ